MFENTGSFYRLQYQFVKKLMIKCKELQLILDIFAVEINLTITMTYLQLETRIMHDENISKQIFWHSNRQRESAIVILRWLSGPRQPTTLWPKAPNFAL